MPYRIAVTGSTGLVGTQTLEYFQGQGHQLSRIVRPQTKDVVAGNDTISWDIPDALIEEEKLEGQDVIIHLAGASIAGAKWTAEYKRTLFSSRVDTTRFLCETLAKLKRKPKVLLSASAVGYYGAQPPQDAMDERSPLGNDFLAQVCQHWEAATAPASDAGIRVCLMRFGVILSKKGGALQKMMPPFQAGVGGKLGSGQQMFSWIALDEIPYIMQHLIEHQEISGPVNVTAPHPVSNQEFTKQLGRVLHRPTVLPVPALAVKLHFGEMGETCLLSGQKVLPKVLKDSQYPFKYPTIDAGLSAALKG
jgi:uncharacterized protein